MSDRENLLSRRGVLSSVGALALGFGGGVLLNGNFNFPESELPAYIAQQGKLRWELDPLSYRDWTVQEFYDYKPQGGQSGEFPVDISETEDASRLFVYSGPVDDSLVFYHGSAEATSGGTAFLKFSGLSRSEGEWAVRDDTMSVDDDFEKWEGGNAKAKWEWGAHETDGGAFWGPLDRKQYTIKITPKTLRGVDSWLLLSGTGSLGPRRIELARDEPVKIQPAKRPVRSVNMDIMPNSSKNVFDPYAKRRITVALEPGGEIKPTKLDPGNYSVYFGSKSYLAGGNGAQPSNYWKEGDTFYFDFKLKSANFSLNDDYGYLVTKAPSGAFVRGRDFVNPGGIESDAKAKLVLQGYNIDPSGNDHKNLNDEWVKFKNDGGKTLDFTGWTVADADSNTYQFPGGYTLDGGQSVMLHTGSGTDTQDHLYWGQSSAVWQNGGDVITVRDSGGNIVLYHAYPSS